MKKILSILLIGVIAIGLTGCETKEEKLQRELEENKQKVRDSVSDYLDLQETISDYYRYKNAVDNAR